MKMKEAIEAVEQELGTTVTTPYGQRESWREWADWEFEDSDVVEGTDPCGAHYYHNGNIVLFDSGAEGWVVGEINTPEVPFWID